MELKIHPETGRLQSGFGWSESVVTVTIICDAAELDRIGTICIARGCGIELQGYGDPVYEGGDIKITSLESDAIVIHPPEVSPRALS
ncbi:MAG: hypothetical protein ACR2IE_20270 [Candidatus Sumerlaeaceae bacterium]